MPKWWKAIIGTSADPINWRIYAALRGDEFTWDELAEHCDTEHIAGYECHGVSNYLKLDCMFNTFFRLTYIKKT